MCVLFFFGGGGEGVITVCVVTCRDRVGACVFFFFFFFFGGEGVITVCVVTCRDRVGACVCVCVWGGGCYYSLCTYLWRQGWGVCGGAGCGSITVCVLTCGDRVGAYVGVLGVGVLQSVYLLVETELGRMWGCWVWEY